MRALHSDLLQDLMRQPAMVGPAVGGLSTAGSLDAHPASQGTASVGAARPKPMIIRRVYLGWRKRPNACVLSRPPADGTSAGRYAAPHALREMFPDRRRHNRRA